MVIATSTTQELAKPRPNVKEVRRSIDGSKAEVDYWTVDGEMITVHLEGRAAEAVGALWDDLREQLHATLTTNNVY
jgi:hypothetical protein